MMPQFTMAAEETAIHEYVTPARTVRQKGAEALFDIRPLWGPDLGDSFVATMECLSPIGMTREQLVKVFNQRLMSGVRTFIAVVGTRIIGTASLHVLPKLAHEGHPAGLIEDVVVDKEMNHRGIGRALVRRCIEEAHEQGCYKITLDCKAELASYYAQEGFAVSGVCMRLDLEVKSDSDQDEMQAHSL